MRETGQTLPDITNLLQLCELFGVSADYLVREEEQATVKSDQNAKNIARLIREREKIRYLARRYYYTALAAVLMAIGFMLAAVIDSRSISFGIGMGQIVGAGIVWIFYSRAVSKIETLNDAIDSE